MSRMGRRSTRRNEEKQADNQRKAGAPRTSPSQSDHLLMLQRTVGNRAVERFINPVDDQKNSPPAIDQTAAPVPKGGSAPTEKNVDGKQQVRIGRIVEQGAVGGGTGAAPAPKAAPKAAPKPKKAGVESFSVKWSENSSTGPKTAALRLDYNAKFKKDEDHDPALAEFRQNVMTKYEVTDGPNKGTKGDTSPMHDDNYSRADDLRGNTKSDVDFYSNDNPGLYDWLDKDDDLNYSFTAEQMIIDTSRSNKVLEKRGPATGTIKGKHPRKVSLPGRC